MLPNRCGALPGHLFLKQKSFLTVSGGSFLVIIWLDMISEGHVILSVPDRVWWPLAYFDCTRQVKTRACHSGRGGLLRGFVTVRLSPAKSESRSRSDVAAWPLINFKLEKANPCYSIWGVSWGSPFGLDPACRAPPRSTLEPHWGVPFSLFDKLR